MINESKDNRCQISILIYCIFQVVASKSYYVQGFQLKSFNIKILIYSKQRFEHKIVSFSFQTFVLKHKIIFTFLLAFEFRLVRLNWIWKKKVKAISESEFACAKLSGIIELCISRNDTSESSKAYNFSIASCWLLSLQLHFQLNASISNFFNSTDTEGEIQRN